MRTPTFTTLAAALMIAPVVAPVLALAAGAMTAGASVLAQVPPAGGGLPTGRGITGKMAGETPSPSVDGANNSINTSGNMDLPAAMSAAAPRPRPPGPATLTDEQAKQRLVAAGYADVKGPYRDVSGAWRAVATKGARRVLAWLDADGHGARTGAP